MEERPGRTFELWLLALGLLGVSWLGWLKLLYLASAWNFIGQSGAQPGPVYLAGQGAAWALGGLLCAAGLLLRRRWAPPVTRALVLALVAWYWVDALALTRAPDVTINWSYMLVFSVLCIAFALGVLALGRQKRFFKG